MSNPIAPCFSSITVRTESWSVANASTTVLVGSGRSDHWLATSSNSYATPDASNCS